MLGYPRTTMIGLLTLLAVSIATIVPAMAGPGHFIAPCLGNESQLLVPARTARQLCLPIVICSSTAGQVSCRVLPCGIVIVVARPY